MLRLLCFWERAPGTKWISGCVGSRMGLDAAADIETTALAIYRNLIVCFCYDSHIRQADSSQIFSLDGERRNEIIIWSENLILGGSLGDRNIDL